MRLNCMKVVWRPYGYVSSDHGLVFWENNFSNCDRNCIKLSKNTKGIVGINASLSWSNALQNYFMKVKELFTSYQ